MSKSLIYKRLPAIYCRIIDLQNGIYEENEKILYTAFGPIKRVRIISNIIFKKISLNSEENFEESMIKSDDQDNVKTSFLIDDGTGNIWVNFWGTDPNQYNNFNSGDLVQFVGTVKKNDQKNLTIYSNFINKLDDPNYETLSILEMVKSIRKNGKYIYKEKNNNKIEINQNDINKFIGIEGNIEPNQRPSQNTLDNNQKIENILDEDEIGEKIIEIISKNDKGDGVGLQIILNNLEIEQQDLIQDIITRLCLNTKIYSIKEDIYKLYLE